MNRGRTLGISVWDDRKSMCFGRNAYVCEYSSATLSFCLLIWVIVWYELFVLLMSGPSAFKNQIWILIRFGYLSLDKSIPSKERYTTVGIKNVSQKLSPTITSLSVTRDNICFEYCVKPKQNITKWSTLNVLLQNSVMKHNYIVQPIPFVFDQNIMLVYLIVSLFWDPMYHKHRSFFEIRK